MTEGTAVALAGFVLALILATLALVGYAILQVRRASDAQSETIRRMATTLAEVKGVPPHIADPERISPNGMPWEKVEEQHATVIDINRKRALDRRKWQLKTAIESPNLQGGEARRKSLQQELDSLEEKAE